MANSLDELLQKFVNMDYDELLTAAKEGLMLSHNIFARYSDEEHATVGVVTFLAAAIAVDGTFSAIEKKLIRDLFGEVDFMGILRTIDDEDYDSLDKIVDRLSDEEKNTLCLFAAYILAVDEHINADEYKYLVKLIS